MAENRQYNLLYPADTVLLYAFCYGLWLIIGVKGPTEDAEDMSHT